MLGHISFGVLDLNRAIRFYEAALLPLGLVRVWSDDRAAGFGVPGGQDLFAVKCRDGAHAPGPGFHLAFDASSRAAVNAFHAAAVENGGLDDGQPGLRPHYGDTYFAAFVIDPDGYRVEAVHQGVP